MSSHKRPLRLLTVLGAALLPPSILPLGFSVRRLSAVGSVQHDSLDKVASLAAAGVPRVVVLLRHGEKQAPAAPVDADTASDAEYWQGVNGVALTADGLLRSQELGKALRARGLEPGELLSSEVPRCVETIQAVAGSCDVPVQFRAALMNATHRPGEEKEAADEMRAVGWPAILERLCCDERVPGFLSLRETVQNLREACWPCQVVADTEGGAAPLELVLVCTHDVFLYALAAWFARGQAERPRKPEFLETAVWWQEGGTECFRYDGKDFSEKLYRV